MLKRILLSASLLAGFTVWGQDETELDKCMKQVGEANGRIRKATSLEDVAKDAETIRGLLKQSEAFWAKNSKSDALKWNQEGQEAAKALATAAASGSKESTDAAAKTMGGSCQACHKVYRERLPDGSYKLKM